MAITNASRLADFGSGIGTYGAVIQVDNTNKRVGIGTTNPQATLQVGTAVSVYGTTGIVSAKSFYGDAFYGDGSGLTGVASTDNIITGVAVTVGGILRVTDTTQSTSSTTGSVIVSGGVGIAKSLNVGGNISVGGTLTYEDVTNVDAVGVITARGGIEIGASGVGGTISPGGNVKFTGITTVGAGLSFADDIKAKFGAGGDLSIYHNGSNSYIDNNTASVYIRSNVDNDDGGNIYIQAKSGENSIICNDDGNVQLYYDNYNAFQTNANGIKVQGPSGGAAILYLNADQGSDDADKFRFKAEDDGPLKIENDTSGSWETSIEINGNGNVELYYDNSKKLETHNTGIRVTGIATVTSTIYVNTNGSSIAENNLNFASSGKAYIDHRTTSQDIDFRVSHGSALDRTAITIGSAGITTFYGTPHDNLGSLRDIPYNGNSGAYTLVASDAGKVVGADTSWIIPASVFSAGNTVTLLNLGGTNLSLDASALTYLWNTADGTNIKASTLTLGPRSMATIWFGSGTTGYIQAAALNIS